MTNKCVNSNSKEIIKGVVFSESCNIPQPENGKIICVNARSKAENAEALNGELRIRLFDKLCRKRALDPLRRHNRRDESGDKRRRDRLRNCRQPRHSQRGNIRLVSERNRDNLPRLLYGRYALPHGKNPGGKYPRLGIFQNRTDQYRRGAFAP